MFWAPQTFDSIFGVQKEIADMDPRIERKRVPPWDKNAFLCNGHIPTAALT